MTELETWYGYWPSMSNLDLIGLEDLARSQMVSKVFWAEIEFLEQYPREREDARGRKMFSAPLPRIETCSSDTVSESEAGGYRHTGCFGRVSWRT